MKLQCWFLRISKADKTFMILDSHNTASTAFLAQNSYNMLSKMSDNSLAYSWNLVSLASINQKRQYALTTKY